MKRIFSLLLLLLVVASVAAQKPTRRELREQRKVEVQRMVDSLLGVHEFTFVAQRVVTSLPERPYITLNGDDMIIVSEKSVVSSLPFYGQLYSAPMGSTDSPLSFSSNDFTYEPLGGRERKSLVQIKAKTSSLMGTYTIVFEVFSDATAVANITMARGSSSMFFGYIKPSQSQQTATKSDK